MARTKPIKKSVKKAKKDPVKKVVVKTVHLTKDVVESPKPIGTSTSVVGMDGSRVGNITLPKELFAARVNAVLLAQAVRVHLANQREGSASTKTRGEVEGSTRKIYRQKGTGRARHGAIRAPIFVGGGIVFGPRPRDYHLELSKKMKRVALASALTSKLLDRAVIVIEGLASMKPKTSIMDRALTSIGALPHALLIVSPKQETVLRAARNLADTDTMDVRNLNAYDVLSHRSLIFMKESIPVLTQTFGNKKGIV